MIFMIYRKIMNDQARNPDGAVTPALFRGYAQTVKAKKLFLEEYPRQGYRMKETAHRLRIAPGTVTNWCLRDPRFKEAYLELKAQRPRPEPPPPRPPRRIPPPRQPIPRDESAKRTVNTVMSESDIAEAKQKIIEIYEEKKHPLSECCTQAKVTTGLAREWLSADPAFRRAYQAIAAEKRGIGAAISQERAGIIAKANEAAEAARMARQETFLKAYIDTTFNITEACKITGIRRETFKRWLKQYPEFKERFEEAFESKKDFIESKLLENIKANDSACIIHASKTLLRDRGYGEKQEIEFTGKHGVMIVPGTVLDLNEWAAKATTQQQALKETLRINGPA